MTHWRSDRILGTGPTSSLNPMMVSFTSLEDPSRSRLVKASQKTSMKNNEETWSLSTRNWLGHPATSRWDRWRASFVDFACFLLPGLLKGKVLNSVQQGEVSTEKTVAFIIEAKTPNTCAWEATAVIPAGTGKLSATSWLPHECGIGRQGPLIVDSSWLRVLVLVTVSPS